MTDPISQPEVEDFIPPDPPTGLRTFMPAHRAARRRQEIAASVEQRRRERLSEALSAVLATEAGQIVVMRLLDHCRPYHTTLSSEPTQYAAAEGRRTVGLWLIQQITGLGPEVYPHLLVSHAKRQRVAADEEASYARNAR